MKKNNNNKNACYVKAGVVFYKKDVNNLCSREVNCIRSYSDK